MDKKKGMKGKLGLYRGLKGITSRSWFLRFALLDVFSVSGNGGVDPCSSPDTITSPFIHSLLNKVGYSVPKIRHTFMGVSRIKRCNIFRLRCGPPINGNWKLP